MDKEMQLTEYDREELFRKEVAPKLKELMKVCSINNIPCFATFAVKNSEIATKYASDMVSAITSGVRLKNDNIRKCANVLNGFDIVAESKQIEIDM